MTEHALLLASLTVGLPALGALLVAAARTPRQADAGNVVVAVLTAAVALTLAAVVLARGGAAPIDDGWTYLDGAGGVFLALTAVVGLGSALLSPVYLRHAGRTGAGARGSRARYYVALHLFWAALLAVPLAGNLGVAWLLVEATTAASALLVAFTGSRHALEAGWKYLVLTSLGLSVALLGIVVLTIALPGGGLSTLDWRSLHEHSGAVAPGAGLLAFVLILAGLATKIGWAPVHNWLPDAHSEAPAPVSALLSAALLPSVLLVAWRVRDALEPAVGASTARALFLGFGLASLLVAVPFLWRALPFKRLLAFSSLEHMGVIALGVGFGTPLAIAGVLLHVAGHGLAKSLGFYSALPLLRHDPRASHHAPDGVAATSPATAAAMGVSLGALGGLPPSPLFLSELLVLAGGIQAGRTAVVAIAAVALALGFLGLLHALLEGVVGPARRHRRHAARRSERRIAAMTAVLAIGLLALTAAGLALPGSELVDSLATVAP
ncbi:proton-conducting transporter transmembrane domain-containing protein [Capillimicrobium parvum]|uniref:NAD(P)H-quinone oxidoreductase subunit 2, chloroplastic n=1 Tax=Capillimicrobium parvum TaxID=2884022 RepID=A0A9E6XWI9_9ACTN|nr:proton-conducting transporter membrane subunit [Capillimicrobium parvum]UGS35786.1 NAD(P)H-quinone oxidoreductase subunit 2, chloroplastic [Capillimicrobium parvum]